MLLLLGIFAAVPSQQQQLLLDLSAATIVIQQPAPVRAAVYSEMLMNEIYQRTAITLKIKRYNTTDNGTHGGQQEGPRIILSAASLDPVAWHSGSPEGYTLTTTAHGTITPSFTPSISFYLLPSPSIMTCAPR